MNIVDLFPAALLLAENENGFVGSCKRRHYNEIRSTSFSYLFCRLRRSEENRDESEPNDARGVHGEADGLGLVEGLGHPSRLYGVHRARDHQ